MIVLYFIQRFSPTTVCQGHSHGTLFLRSASCSISFMMAANGRPYPYPSDGYPVIIVGALLIFMLVLMTTGRFVARTWQSVGFGIDDYSLVLATVRRVHVEPTKH